MTIKHFAATLVLAIALFVPAASSFAQSPAQPAPLAEVNIQGVKISNQVNNVLNISFMLTNRSGIQTGVRYGVRLVPSGKANVIADEKVFDDTLTLQENSSTQKSVIYSVPQGLSGSYDVYVISMNAAGFPFGLSSAGTVMLEAVKSGVEIVPGSCTLGANGKRYAYGESPTVAAEDNLTVSCMAVNHAVTSVALFPSVKTFHRSMYGEAVQTQEATQTAIVLRANEKKAISIVLPKDSKPGFYAALLSLSFGPQSTNSIPLSYSISGTSAAILNVSADADHFMSGSSAKLSVLSTGSAPSKGEFSIEGANNAFCGSTTLQSVVPGTQEVAVPITADCYNPVITAVLTDPAGMVLDSKSFSIPTVSVAIPGELLHSMKGIVALVVIVLLLIILLAVYLKKRNKPIEPTTIIPILILALSLAVPFSKVHADTFPAGSNGQVQVIVNIDNLSNPGSTTYKNGDKIKATGAVLNTSATAQTVSLTAITIGNTSVNLFPSPAYANPLVIQPNVIVQGDDQLFIVNVPSPGTYTVDFTAGIDENPVVNHISHQNLVDGDTYQPAHANGINVNVCLDTPAAQDESFTINWTGKNHFTNQADNGSVAVNLNQGEKCIPVDTQGFAYFIERTQNPYRLDVTSQCIAPQNPGITVDPSIHC